LADTDPWVTNVRGRGLCAGLDIVAATGEHFAPELRTRQRIQAEARRRGLMTRGFDGDMFGFAPPLVITEGEIDEIVDIFAASLATVRSGDDQR
jgi:L-2,4-diaminobutyrate transaminase